MIMDEKTVEKDDCEMCGAKAGEACADWCKGEPTVAYLVEEAVHMLDNCNCD
jgi:hypothetical protein